MYDALPIRHSTRQQRVGIYQTLFLLLLSFLSTPNFSATSLVLLHRSNLLMIVLNPYWIYENEKMTKKAAVQGAATFQK
jgi:Na+-driven multidrug efflux pump